MALYQKVHTVILAHYKELSLQEFPEDDPDDALNKLIIRDQIKDVFFLNQAGERCLWGKSMHV
jgi:hypothetical protein